MRRFLEKRPIPVIAGPEDDHYLIDHHQLCLALWHNEVDEVLIRVVSDLSDMPRRELLRSMSALGWLHAYDARGQKSCPTKLRPSIDQLRPDPYRDLAWSVREAGGFRKTGIPFIEFTWATTSGSIFRSAAFGRQDRYHAKRHRPRHRGWHQTAAGRRENATLLAQLVTPVRLDRKAAPTRPLSKD